MSRPISLTVKNSPATIHEAATALHRKEISAVELCTRLIERRRTIDVVINGFRSLDEDAVLAQARAADQRRMAGQSLGAYDGIPIAIKDNISVAGQPCGCSSKILEKYIAPYDATVVARLKQAGFIAFGRTNMDEFAMGSSTEHSAYGVTRNPWDLERVPGGSSGGSAAVVASGQALAALGSDTGGSIRQPASFCGVVGFKPTYGLVSRYGLVAFASSLDQIGPITNDVRDTAILMDVIAGHDVYDATSLPDAQLGFADALETAGAKFTIGLPKEFFAVEGLSSATRRAVDKAVATYQNTGCDVVEVSIPHMSYSVASYYIIATAEASSNLARFDGVRYGNRAPNSADLTDMYVRTRELGFGDEVKRRIILGTYALSSGYYDAYYLRAQKVRTLIRRDFEQAFVHCDLLITPVAPTPAFKIGEVSDPITMYLSDICTIPVNLAGVCGISVPAGMDEAGLPIGVQLIGASMQDKKLLQAAHWLMKAK